MGDVVIDNQWYAVFWSKKLKSGNMIGARRFGKDLLFLRDQDGKVSCLSNVCTHRGAALDLGKFSDGHICCPFHGIEFDPNGACVHIPASGRCARDKLTRFQLKSYPVYEVGDIVFVWYGEGVPSEKPDYFDLLDNSEFSYSHLEDIWHVHYSRVIENQLDVSHLPFVHRTTIGRGRKTLVNGPKVLWIDENTLQTSADNEVDEGQFPKKASDCRIKNTNLTFKFPNLWLNTISDKLKILGFFIPVDEETSILAVRFYHHFTGIRPLNRFIAWLGKWANKVVERQDKKIVETQIPKKSGLGIGENLVSADLPIIEFRKKRAKLQKEAEKKAVLQ